MSLQEYYDLLWAAAYLLDYIVFLLMAVSYTIAVFNPPITNIISQMQDKEEEEEQSRMQFLQKVATSQKAFMV